jgi:Zn-finger nucleic acid-binding protein
MHASARRRAAMRYDRPPMVYRASPAPPGTCPRCRETLLGVKRGRGLFPVDRAPGVRWCDRCGGVMADVAASRRIIAVLDRELVEIGFLAGRGKPLETDEGRVISCPECQFEMVRTRVDSANCVVDACPSHGTWFDAGELEAVTRAYARARRAGVRVKQAAPNPAAFGVAQPSPAAPDAAPDTLPPTDTLTALVDFVRVLLGAAISRDDD